MQVLKRTGEELNQGQSRLKELVERMKREEEELDRDTAILEQKKVALVYCSSVNKCDPFLPGGARDTPRTRS